MAMLTLKNLSFTYPNASEPAVREVCCEIGEGELVVLCGATGCGKSTLLRLIKRELTPNGQVCGEVLLGDQPISRVPADRIGYVMQRPDEQLVTDKVYSELAFGLESMGAPQAVIARRVAEMASYFGIEEWFDREVSTLSGGQRQLLNLASVMVMDPALLILDEPTSQLDPIATVDFFDTLLRLHRDFSLTVMIAEHRLEELIPSCDRLLVVADGALTANGAPREILSSLHADDALLLAMPTATRLYHALGGNGSCPMTPREGRALLAAKCCARRIPAARCERVAGGAALELRDVFFRYERTRPDVLRGMNLTVYENEIFCLLGGNGSGKSTALACAAALRKPYSGEIRVFGKRLRDYPGQSLYRGCLTLLPQDVQSVFLCNTVREELEDARVTPDALPFDLSPWLGRHPYDLSGGEQQLVALAKVLATEPRLLLMDEPTQGLDAEKRQRLIGLLRSLRDRGMTVLIVTHDVDFAAACADRCALLFRGETVSVGAPRDFFSENLFYTTAAARISKGYFEGAVTVEDIVALCRACDGREGEDGGALE